MNQQCQTNNKHRHTILTLSNADAQSAPMDNLLTLGVLSGTSVDAIDIALVSWQGNNPTLLAFQEYPWPCQLQQRLLQLPEQPQLSLAEYGQLHTACGQAFARSITQFLTDSGYAAADIQVIGSHGQTIWHQPTGTQPFSLQLGHPAIIAKQTGINVAADFRMDDIAVQGNGAPLAPAFHAILMAQQTTAPFAVINLGGIANISVCNPITSTRLGYDTGPANTLLDAWFRLHQQQDYDMNGAWAASAAIQPQLLDKLLQHPFFTLPCPKSTGREDFSLAWLQQQLQEFETLSAAEVHSTLLQLTVESLAERIEHELSAGSHIWLCGGGARNSELVKRLSRRLPHYSIAATDMLGYSANAIEAMLFAWLGKQRLLAEPIDLTDITHSNRPTVLGGLWLA